MGKKKKKREEERKPWCYYCDREFLDETTLILHQKAKHFRCSSCHKKMTTAPSLAIHCSHVHKSALSKVPNAKPGRDNIELEIFGMAGIPEEALLDETPKPPDEGPQAKVPRIEAVVLPPPTLARPSAAPGQAPHFPRPTLHPPAGQHLMHQPPYPGSLPQFSAPAGSLPPPAFSMPYGTAPLPFAPGRPPIGFPGPAQPLFPIAKGGAPDPAHERLSVPGVQAPTAAPAGAAKPAPVSDAKLLWTDEAVSMEERRAELATYALEPGRPGILGRP